MATIKVKLHPSSIQRKAGTIYYQVTHRHTIRCISTNLHIMPKDWDEIGQRIVSDDIAINIIQNRIDCEVSLLQAIIKNLSITGLSYTADDIVRLFKTPGNNISIISFMKEQIEYLRRCNKFGTAKNYECAMRSFARSLNGDIAIIAINERIIKNYNVYLLQRGIMRNSISFYMRILRAVYNKAVYNHLTEQTNPFQNVYTGIDNTKKKAIDEKIIAKLYKLDLSKESHLELARDIFIFSYCARGMAFVDIAYLKKKDIQDGTICYTRHKTGQLLSVKIEPNMKKIIDKHTNSTSIYVFPFLNSSDTNNAYNQYRKAINLYNRQLKELSQKLPINGTLTSYTARHSWANAARKHNAPIAIISAGLGHTSEKTTRIYLTSLENNAIDAVNKGIISMLLK